MASRADRGAAGRPAYMVLCVGYVRRQCRRIRRRRRFLVYRQRQAHSERQHHEPRQGDILRQLVRRGNEAVHVGPGSAIRCLIGRERINAGPPGAVRARREAAGYIGQCAGVR